MKKRTFTLVELLVVIGIILLLAGLLVPAVSGVQKQGRVTQAKSDMSTISMALSALAADNGGECVFSSTETVTTGTGKKKKTETVTLYKWGGQTAKDSSNVVGVNGAVTKGLIYELSDPGSGGTVNNNKRKIRYLDPSVNYKSDNASGTDDEYWPDPWGNLYSFWFNADGSGKIDDVHDSMLGGPKGSKHAIYANFAIWSYGPNGKDDTGCNVETDDHGTPTADDIATWHK